MSNKSRRRRKYLRYRRRGYVAVLMMLGHSRNEATMMFDQVATNHYARQPREGE